jgi:hypothetical protein
MQTAARLIATALLALAPAAAGAADKPVEVMIVAAFHMANPGKDALNTQSGDVLLPAAQAEIQKVTDALARFKPTIVAAEWPAEIVAARWPKYLDGSLEPSRNEVVQLGFRLAKQTGAKVIGADAPADFPYGPVTDYAKAHGREAIMAGAMGVLEAQSNAANETLKTKGIVATLRLMNDPARLAADNGFYRTTLRIGGGAEQPGVNLLAAWQRRNLMTCAILIQAAQPGDRAVVFFGAGHAYLLRQCVQETPGFKLVEANAWLPAR